nr:putative Gag-polypeptide of LTR copia-type [Tanacetum cinerariifolium]
MIRVAIGGKSKALLSHLTSDPPSQDNESYEQWEQEDLIVFSWIIQNIKPTIAGNLTEYLTAKMLWGALVVTYSSGRDKLQTFNLHVKANDIKQNDSPLEELWITLQGVWGEIDRIDPNPMKCPDDIKAYAKIRTGAIIGRGTERQGLYYVDEVAQNGTVLLSHGTKEREAWLWHKRLGHPSTGYLHMLFPKTAKEILVREREINARTTLLMAIPEDHLAKFHKMTDAKEMWEAIKSRFGENDESKKRQKYLLKQQFESFYVSNSEGLHKGYDMFQSLLSQLKTHGVDTLNFDDLYNNLRVFEYDFKGSTGSSSSTQNVAFVSSDNTSCTNKVNTAYGVSTSSGHNSQKEGSSSHTDDIMYSFFVAKISTRLKKFYKKTGRKLHFDTKEPIGFDKIKVKCFNFHNTGHFAKECRSKGNQDSRRRDAGNTGYKARDNGKRPAKQDEHKAMNLKKKKEELKTKLENFQSYSNGLSKLLNSQMSAKDKSRLGSSDVEDRPINDRFAKVEGMHVVPPYMTGNYMPPKFDFRLDESKFTYGIKQSITSESNAKTSDLDSCDSSFSVETLESVPKPVANEPKSFNEPKVWSDAPIIEEYESKAYLVHYQDFNGGPVAFRGSKGPITGKGKIKIGKLDFEDVYFVKELHHLNLFSVSQMCDKKNKAEAVSTACYVLNRVLVTKPQNKTPYELLIGEFAEKSDERFLVGYSLSSKAFRPITAKHKANHTADPKETNNSAASSGSGGGRGIDGSSW